MKKCLSNIIVTTFCLTLILVFSNQVADAATPSHAYWLKQTGVSYDSLTQISTIHLEWLDGIVDANNPLADGYYVYRSVVGYFEKEEEFELVGVVMNEMQQPGLHTYADDVPKQAGYYYYVRGFIGENIGNRTEKTIAVAPGSYCVNLDAAIVDFISFPETIAKPGEQYIYNAYAKHRSPRVQGWVRYSLLSGPDGMTIDEKEGILNWSIPHDANGEYYVEIKATSNEDSRAESIQEWYIRIATNEEMKFQSTTSVNEQNLPVHFNLFPVPAENMFTIEYNAINERIIIEVINTNGVVVSNEEHNVVLGENQLKIPTQAYLNGTYFIRITDGSKQNFGKLIINK